jgi:spore germination cell wall hydrolase CwlJ-like protein
VSRIALVQRRLSIRLAAMRWETMALALAGLAALVALGLTLAAKVRERAEASAAVAVPIAPVKASALLHATSSARALEVRAIGQAAEQINAALPFSNTPVEAAAPFLAPTGGTAYDRALTCLSQAVYYEAGYEPLPGRRAVAQVILNRMRHPAFPKSVCGVVYQANATPICQFTFACDGSLNRRASAAAWAEARRVAEAALAGHVETSVGQATHYHADYVAPYWAPMLTKISQIGAHIFYRWPGAWGERGAFTGRYIGEPSDPVALRPENSAPVLAQGEKVSDDVAITPAALTFEQDKTIRRAANDVGGLIDPAKGWQLSIPTPEESAARTRALLAQQEQRAASYSKNPAATVAAVVGASSGTAAAAAAQ